MPSAAVPAVAVFVGAGANGSTRIKITIPDNTITNTWLRVTVVANATTGLQTNDVFYFGHVLADVNIGNTSIRYRVNASDVTAVREHQSIAANSVGITNIYDLNRDGRVNATDVSIVRENQQIAGIVGPLTVPGA